MRGAGGHKDRPRRLTAVDDANCQQNAANRWSDGDTVRRGDPAWSTGLSVLWVDFVSCDGEHSANGNSLLILLLELHLREMNPGTKWLDTPAAHIATASFIASGMVVALAIKLFLHNQQIVSTILGVAIAGASIPLLISLTEQVLKANFSVDILAPCRS